MKCKTWQRELMMSDDPVRPPLELQAHADRCPACRDWQNRLVQVERHVPHLPVPQSKGLAEFQQRILFRPFAEEEPRPILPLEHPRLKSARLIWTAAAVAAALLIACFVGWSLIGGCHQGAVVPVAKSAPDPLLANLLERNLSLAKAQTTRDRLDALADLSGDLHDETMRLARAAEPKDLSDLAQLYSQVLRQGVAEHARVLPREQAQALDPIAARLAQVDADASALAQELPNRSAGPLRSMAEAAREVRLELRRPPTPTPMEARPETTEPDAAEIVRHFQRNRPLIQALVDSSLRLASEKEPLKRAQACNDVAGLFAGEIQKAAQEHEGSRAAELGQHFRSLLRGGVALNLTAAAKQIPPGSAHEPELVQVGVFVARMTKPVEAQLLRAANTDSDMQEALEAVFQGRMEVENALKGRSLQPERDKGKSNPGKRKGF